MGHPSTSKILKALEQKNFFFFFNETNFMAPYQDLLGAVTSQQLLPKELGQTPFSQAIRVTGFRPTAFCPIIRKQP